MDYVYVIIQKAYQFVIHFMCNNMLYRKGRKNTENVFELVEVYDVRKNENKPIVKSLLTQINLVI